MIAAKADNYRLAMRAGENDLISRYEAMHRMVSPGTLIALCAAWRELRDLKCEIPFGDDE